MSKITFSLIRNGVTATSVDMDILKMESIRRWITSSLRLSGTDAKNYQFVAYSDLQDISGTDRLEELTGGVTGSIFKIINKRELSGSHMEFDLDRTGNG